MLWPRAEGEFERWETLEPTLMPILKTQVGAMFMPWTVANETAITASREEFSVELKGRTWTQKSQKYRRALDAVLDRAECLAGLRG
jgi:hypothetical protein